MWTSARTPGDRIASVDALRGFALLGILVVNIAFFGSGYRMAGLPEPGFDSALDWGVRWFVTMFMENKFYLLFSFLFGYSLTLQLDSAARRGAAFSPMFLRRLAGLFLLGLAHAVLLFPGDILVTYALVGLVLLALRRITPRKAVILAVALTSLLAAGFVLAALVAALGFHVPGVGASGVAEALRADVLLRDGPGKIISEHLHELSMIVVLRVLFQGPAVLAACLVGLALGKRGALREPNPRTLRTLQWLGFTVGIAGQAFHSYSAWSGSGDVLRLLGQAVDLVTAPLLAAAYAATLLRLLPHLPGVGRLLAAPGRMALSNYLGQSLICSLIFTGYGLALVDKVSPLVEVLIAVAVFALQAALSHWWLRGRRYGPVEWLLRALTYWRFPSKRVQPT
ncbi:DUF418 domain-containing protein [Nonomuraea sp. NPDC049152]|uniref:DUF418 domain-containing protein n=1 Tax=Nonomuraea sp. NPDC049152 TaxID=3154350 RepID=UPI0033EAFE6E